LDLDRDAAERAARPLARRTGLGLAALCRGVERVAAVATARTLRQVAARAGADPRGAALIAFGGAGPTLACRTAESLGVERIIVPPAPGLFAAAGALRAPLRADASALAPLGGGAQALTRLVRRLRQQVERALAREGAIWTACTAEVEARYVGQAFSVHVPAQGWRAAFHAAHERVHGFADPARDVECVRVHVRGEGSRRKRPARRSRRTQRASLQPAPGRVVSRGDLSAARRFAGPVRIDELTATTYVAKGWTVGVLSGGALELRRDT
jgi:N-methylhydantoinase A